jgi:FAD-linked sulfhydryl oxidase
MNHLRRLAISSSTTALLVGTVLAIDNSTTSQVASTTASSNIGNKPSDCKEAACKSKIDSFKNALNKTGGSSQQEWENEPPSRETLGRAGWTVLHSFAAYYPNEPTEDEKRMARSFLEAFAHLYPCKDCAEGLQINMREYPPKVDSRKDFSIWMCEAHNRVNEQMGKSTTKCELSALDKRWRG